MKSFSKKKINANGIIRYSTKKSVTRKIFKLIAFRKP